MRTYSDLVNDLNNPLRNQLKSVASPRTQINSILLRAVQEYDYQSMQRSKRTSFAIYSDIQRSPLPPDMKPEGLVDIVPARNFERASRTAIRKVSPNNFRLVADRDTVAFESIDGNHWLLSNFHTQENAVLIDTMNALDDNGLWTTADDASDMQTSRFNYISGDGSLSANITAGTTLSIENSTLASVDISETDIVFLWVYLPNATNVSGITIRLGYDAINYYEGAVTTPYNVDSFHSGWNYVGVKLGAVTGIASLSSVNYARLSVNFSASTTLTGVLFDNIIASRGLFSEVIYYGSMPWKSTTGEYKLKSTVNEDILNATEAEYAVFLAECAYGLAPSIPMGDNEVARLFQEKENTVARYKMRYPSRRIRQMQPWYHGHVGKSVVGKRKLELNLVGRGTGIGVGLRFVDEEVLTGTVDGVNNIFTIANEPIVGTLKVYANGVRQTLGGDYTLSGQTITFIIPPPALSNLLCDYRYT